MSSSKTPCASCKTLRRKCINECVFAPYFPPDQPQRFESIHRVYGASNVAKILSDLPTAAERAEAVTSLVYEAEARLKDPIYGCVGSICILQHKLKRIQSEIQSAKLELATFIGPSAMNTVLNTGLMPPFPDQHIIGSKLEQPEASGDAQHNRQVYEAQQHELVEEQDMLKNLEHHQQQQILHYQQQFMDVWRFNVCSDGAGSSGQTQQQQPHPQQEHDLHLQQLVQRQLSLQHQNQPSQP